MPDIDVTELLFDTDLAGNIFTVLRRFQTVNTYGEGVAATTTIPNLIGAIYPTGDNSLVRQEDFQSQANTITVVTTFRLRGPSKDSGNQYDADIVQWSGVNWLVRTVNEFTQYGAGFIEAECTSQDFIDQAPV